MKYSLKFYLEKRQGVDLRLLTISISYANIRVRYSTGIMLSDSSWHYDESCNDDIIRFIDSKSPISSKNNIDAGNANDMLNLCVKIISYIFNIPTQVAPLKNNISRMFDLIFKNQIYNLGVLVNQYMSNITSDVIIEQPSVRSNVSKSKSKQIKVNDNYSEKSDIDYLFKIYEDLKVVSESRLKQIKSMVKIFKSFCNENNIECNLLSFTSDTVSDFEQYLHNNPGRHGTRRSQNFITNVIKKLRAFIGWSRKHLQHFYGIETPNPFEFFSFKPEVYGDPFYLTKEEVNKILHANLSKKPTLYVQRDIFVFQCLCGARVGDLSRFTQTNIVDGVLSYIPNKTKDHSKQVKVEVPLTDVALKIYKKYSKLCKKETDPLFPIFSEYRYNQAIKRICFLARVRREVSVLDPITRQLKKVHIYDVISSHTARKTFIGILYENNVKDEVISSMSGHAERSVAFLRYRKVTNELKRNALEYLG